MNPDKTNIPGNAAEAPRKGRALIAMSGGVDSSVSAALMQEAGYECIGMTMKLFNNEDIGVPRQHSCCSLDDVEDARAVCFTLGIRYYVSNFTDDFNEQVIDRFIHAYEIGATPNPCIDCNRYMKFEKLYHRARELGCDYVVTGHYARIAFEGRTGRWLLKKGVNAAKDQSYVLSFMTQDQLAHTQFPLGGYADKEDVRAVAERYGLINARKHDSQDICFVQDGDYGKFIAMRTGKTYPEGDFVEASTGRVLGRHKGIIRYTIGQRKGLGLALPAPLYVCAKDMEHNRVLLSPESGLYRRTLVADDVNWISMSDPEPGAQVRVTAKPRYRAKEAPATVTVLEDGKVRVTFDEPQRALTVGQTIAMYDGEDVVAGAIITQVAE